MASSSPIFGVKMKNYLKPPPIVYMVLYITGGCFGFQPSTVGIQVMSLQKGIIYPHIPILFGRDWNPQYLNPILGRGSGVLRGILMSLHFLGGTDLVKIVGI